MSMYRVRPGLVSPTFSSNYLFTGKTTASIKMSNSKEVVKWTWDMLMRQFLSSGAWGWSGTWVRL